MTMNLKEARSANIMHIISDLRKSNAIEEIIDIRGMTDGFTVFARGVDGNAYEIEIRPAAFAKGHEEVRGAGKYAERKRKKQEEIRKDFGM